MWNLAAVNPLRALITYFKVDEDIFHLLYLVLVIYRVHSCDFTVIRPVLINIRPALQSLGLVKVLSGIIYSH